LFNFPSAYPIPSDPLRWLLNIPTQPTDNNRTLPKHLKGMRKERNSQDTTSSRSNNTHRTSNFRNSLPCHTRSNHILRTPSSSNINTRSNHSHPMPNSSNSLPCNTRPNNSHKTRAQMRRPLRRRRRRRKNSTAVVFGVIGASRTISRVAVVFAALDVDWWRVLGGGASLEDRCDEVGTRAVDKEIDLE
jgi:hypothetical protein